MNDDDELNPYLAPKTDVSSAPASGDFYVRGKDLICRSGAVLPMRCIKTNAPLGTSQMKTKKLYWASPWVYACILVNILLLIIVYYCIRKPVQLQFGLSDEARRKRHAAVSLFWLLFLGSIVAMVFGFTSDYPSVGIIALLVVLGSLIYLVAIGSVLRAVNRLPTGEFALRGCGREFLASLEHESRTLSLAK